MSTRQYLIDASTRHQVFLLRYAGSTYKQMAKFIEQAKTESLNLLANSQTVLSTQRYKLLFEELTAVNKAIYKDLASSAKKSMTNLAAYEADFTKRMINKATDVPFETILPTASQLNAAAFTGIMDAVPGFTPKNGLTVGSALNDFGAKKASDIVKQVRVGFALGQTIDEISKNISTVADTLIDRQAQALARTITNHVASSARAEFYQQNKDLVTGYQVVATLDDRTTEECAALDGQVFTPEEFEEPPYHWNCRSTFIAVIDPEYDVGSALDGGRPAQNEDGTYSEVSSRTTYNSWINSQPAAFQDEVLGPNKGALLRAGMPVQGFVDEHYQPLTLDELRAKDDQHIFEKAGL